MRVIRRIISNGRIDQKKSLSIIRENNFESVDNDQSNIMLFDENVTKSTYNKNKYITLQNKNNTKFVRSQLKVIKKNRDRQSKL